MRIYGRMDKQQEVLDKLNALTTIIASINDRVGRVETISGKLDEINESLEQTGARVKDIVYDVELLKTRQAQFPPPGPSHSLNFGNSASAKYTEHEEHEETIPKANAWDMLQNSAEDGVAEVHRDFEQIKDGLVKVKLPSDLRVYHSPAGIKAEGKQAYNIIKQVATYQETAAKWLAEQVAQIDIRGNVVISRATLQELFTILLAQATNLRGEYTSLLVASSTNKETDQFYRLFDRNPTLFTDRELSHLARAVDLAGMKAKFNPPPPQQNHQQRRRQF